MKINNNIKNLISNVMNYLLNIKSFTKFLSRNKLYTIIEILGLSISLMFVILIGIYTKQELSVDSFQKDADRIYVLGNESFMISAYGIGERLMTQFPEVEKVMTVSSNLPWGGIEALPITWQDKKINAKIQYTYEDFFDFFSFDLVTGSKSQVLSDKNYAVISDSFAKKFFGDANPIGQTLQISPSISIIVNGIMKDMHNSVIPYCDILARVEKLTEMYPEMDKENYSNCYNSLVFLRTQKGSDLLSKTNDMASFFKGFYWPYERDQVKDVVVVPLRKAYFIEKAQYSMLENGDWDFVIILISVGIVILFFAIINYVNLTVAQIGSRAKEAAIRSLLGSTKKELFTRLILESILLSLVSFLIGLFLATLAIPYANQLLEAHINLPGAVTPINILLGILLILLLGCVSGILPAIHITRAKAVDVMKGSFRMQTKMTFSKFFITFQNAITIALIATSLTMVLQINYLIKAPLGYNTQNIIDIPIGMEELKLKELNNTLLGELKQLACVNKVGCARSTPFKVGNNYTMEINGNLVSLQGFVMDTTSLHILGLKILKDNHLATGEGCFLTDAAFKAMGIGEDAKSFPFFGNPRMIAGKIQDFQLNNITMANPPIFLQLDKTENIPTENLLVEIQGNTFEAYNKVKQVYENITQLEFPGKFIDRQIEESFATQQRILKIISLFAFVAIVISLLGLLAISTYFIQQKAREIAIRKIFGSNGTLILYKLICTFIRYVVIAFIITTPVMVYTMRQWLSNYSYRISLSPFIFISAGLFCLIISFLTVFWQSYRAANQNPIENVKTE